MKLSKKQKSFEKEGKIVKYTQVYVDLGNGTKIAVKAVYKEQQNILNALAERED